MSRLQWVSVDARTGNVLADLTDLYPQGPLKKTIGRYESVSMNYAVGGKSSRTRPPENWLRATLPGGANLIALDPDSGNPVWGGMILQRVRNETDTVTLSVATVEAYLDRRFVGTVTYAGVDQNAIVADLINKFVLDGVFSKAGLPIRCQYSTGGTTRGLIYYDYNDTTVYSALTSLMQLLGGPEWSIEWEWQHNPERITPYIIIGGPGGSNRVGNSAPAGLTPNAQFTLPGSVKSIQVTEDFTTGKAGNIVTAISTGSGISRPTSGPVTLSDPNRPAFEYRYSPQQNLLVPLTLLQYAQQAISIIGYGSQSVALTADYGTAPKVGVDWLAGDDVTYDVANTSQFPGGMTGVGRTIGFELTDENTPTITPVLIVPTVYTGS